MFNQLGTLLWCFVLVKMKEKLWNGLWRDLRLLNAFNAPIQKIFIDYFMKHPRNKAGNDNPRLCGRVV
jgi:hypothetical protein